MTGRRPPVGTRDDEDLLRAFAAVNLATATLHANTLDSPKDAERKTGKGKTRRMREAFAAHRRHVGRMDPPEKHDRVVPAVDGAPRHRGTVTDAASAENPHREFERLPSYRPQLNPVGRFRKELRRRATHDRPFDTLADLEASIRASLSDIQTVRHEVKSLIAGRPERKATK